MLLLIFNGSPVAACGDKCPVFSPCSLCRSFTYISIGFFLKLFLYASRSFSLITSSCNSLLFFSSQMICLLFYFKDRTQVFGLFIEASQFEHNRELFRCSRLDATSKTRELSRQTYDS